MHESTGRASTANESEKDPAGTDSTATSKETLQDLEETQENISSSGSDPDSGPSPDGLLDEPNEIKDAGPM
jgi:hypothetical protein